jgi:hypothetical protein
LYWQGPHLRIMCLMESVDTTVEMPSRAASSAASVDLPVPLVPHSSTATDVRCSRRAHAILKSSTVAAAVTAKGGACDVAVGGKPAACAGGGSADGP